MFTVFWMLMASSIKSRTQSSKRLHTPIPPADISIRIQLLGGGGVWAPCWIVHTLLARQHQLLYLHLVILRLFLRGPVERLEDSCTKPRQNMPINLFHRALHRHPRHQPDTHPVQTKTAHSRDMDPLPLHPQLSLLIRFFLYLLMKMKRPRRMVVVLDRAQRGVQLLASFRGGMYVEWAPTTVAHGDAVRLYQDAHGCRWL
jgi:hypothetical protein